MPMSTKSILGTALVVFALALSTAAPTSNENNKQESIMQALKSEELKAAMEKYFNKTFFDDAECDKKCNAMGCSYASCDGTAPSCSPVKCPPVKGVVDAGHCSSGCISGEHRCCCYGCPTQFFF